MAKLFNPYGKDPFFLSSTALGLTGAAVTTGNLVLGRTIIVPVVAKKKMSLILVAGASGSDVVLKVYASIYPSPTSAFVAAYPNNNDLPLHDNITIPVAGGAGQGYVLDLFDAFEGQYKAGLSSADQMGSIAFKFGAAYAVGISLQNFSGGNLFPTNLQVSVA